MRGVSLTHPVLPRLFCKESFSYTSRASFLFFLFYILFCFIGEFLLNIPYWLHFSVRSFSCTSNVGFILFGGVPLTHSMLASFLSGEFLLNIPCSLFFFFFFNLGSFSYTSHADFVFNCGVSVTRPVVPSFLSREFLLHIPCCPDLYARSFSYISRACILFFFFSSFFFFFFFFFFKYFILLGEFLLHIPCRLHFYMGSFSYTPRAGFNLISGVSLPHPILVSFLSG